MVVRSIKDICGLIDGIVTLAGGVPLRRGDSVVVTLPGRAERRGRLTERSPLLVRGQCITDGWYVSWVPLPVEQWESTGGWHPLGALRLAASEKAASEAASEPAGVASS